MSSSSLSSAREWRLTERDGGLELDVREVIRGQKDAASAAGGGVGVPRDGEGGLVPVRIEWLVLAVRGGDSKRDGLLGKRPAQVGIVSCQAEEGVEVPGIVEIPDLIDGNAAKKGLRVLKAFRTAQTGPIIIKPTTPDQRYADIQQELKRMNRTVVEISVFCDENQDAKMNVYMVDTIVNSGIEDTFGMLGEISCRDGLGRASVGVMESTKTADQSILIVRFDVTGLARSGSKVLLSNTWAGDLLYSFKILRTSSTVRQYPALQTISYLENLNSEQNQFWGFVKNSRYFDRFMARNRSTPTKIGEDYSQIFLIVASTSFICLCVMSLVLIAKLGSPSKNLIDIVDIALLEEEAPTTNFKPGAGKYENSDTCCICMEDFTLDEEICEIKKCCHRLHPSCLEQWVIRNQQCPLCKTALILTRQVILVKKDKGKLFSTQGLSKKQIRSIESRLVIEPGPRIYFSRPIKKKAVKVLSSIQSQASQNQNPITQDSQQSRKSNPSKRARKLIALKKIKLPTHPKHKKRPSKRILRAKKTDKISRQRNGASKQPCETKFEDTTTDTGPLNQDTSSADLLPRIDQSFP